jgi:hypothetical protein
MPDSRHGSEIFYRKYNQKTSVARKMDANHRFTKFYKAIRQLCCVSVYKVENLRIFHALPGMF